MDLLTSQHLRTAIPMFKIMAALVIVLALGATLMIAKDPIVHLALAILLSFLLAPIVNWLERSGLGRGSSITAALTTALTLITALTWMIYSQSRRLAEELPTYEPVIREKISGFARMLSAEGPFTRAAAVFSRALEDLEKLADQDAAPSLPTVKISTDESALEGLLHILEPIFHPVVTLVVVLLLAAFMLAKREDLRNRLLKLAGTDDLQQTTYALDDAGRRVSKLLLTQLIVNFGFGALIGAGLWLIGVPSPFLWGIFAGVMRFVPYIGAVVGLIPPLFLAFAVDPTWASLLWTVALFAITEPILGHVLEPMLYGHSAGISAVAMIVAATIWGFLWGPIGLVLSTPLTICLVVMGKHVKRLAFLDTLLGDTPVLLPHEVFYQRMLAGDPHEAATGARDYLRDNSLSSYYDSVALPAFRRAHQDIVRGHVTGARLETLTGSAQKLVSSLQIVAPANGEAAAELKQQLASGLQRYRTGEGIVVIHGPHPLDAAAAAIAAQVIEAYDIKTTVLPLAGAAEVMAAPGRPRYAAAIMSFVEPVSVLHLRLYGMQTRRYLGKVPVLFAVWQEMAEDLQETYRRKLKVTDVVTTTEDVVTALAEAVDGEPKSATRSHVL